MVTAHEWSVVGPDGLTESSAATGSAFMCLDEDELLPTSPFTPASKYRGSIVLDSKSTSGALLFRPSSWPPGWEWIPRLVLQPDFVISPRGGSGGGPATA